MYRNFYSNTDIAVALKFIIFLVIFENVFYKNVFDSNLGVKTGPSHIIWETLLLGGFPQEPRPVHLPILP